MATHEIEVMQRLRHPNLLPLLASSHEPVHDKENGVSAFYMLFPLYEVRVLRRALLLSGERLESEVIKTPLVPKAPVQEGSLVDLLERCRNDGAHLTLQDVLGIFLQVCAGDCNNACPALS